MNDSDPIDVTEDQQANPTPPSQRASADLPESIGRYRVEKVLGQGGFGLVYLAYDEQLARPVAVKVPHAQLISRPEDAEAYLAEARTVASLDHPGIVPVHDVGSTEACRCFIVSKYVEGTDLATRIKEGQLKYTESAELVATVAEALHYAHKQGLVHRDVKPGNILVAGDGKPHVVDFGLALREENVGKGPMYAGTPAYMSPEQARGEGHRVDGRCDIFSLGVVLYELLVGRRPFRGDTQAELWEQVTSYEPRPLRQYDEKLPKELERICLKALAKLASERYSTAHDMAADLRHFLAEQSSIPSGTSPAGSGSVASETQTAAHASTSVKAVSDSAPRELGTTSDSQPIKIVPKGLRSFDAHDADFFLELLPGPRDREGLPDSLRFWKTRIEEADPDNTFSVGLIYGPSGCGKSSLVKAGLLPRLSEQVIPVYIEATPEDTETRLLRGLRKHCPAVEQDLSLKETLAALRQGQGVPAGKKVLIVLDQFEQWLHAKKEEDNTDLVQALRQCDGARVQCIVMVRDDFWMAATRFLRELEVRLAEGHNSAAVDLFPIRHAEKVLAAFGRAFGALPDQNSETAQVNRDFLKESVAGIAEEGKVICVRLALFAEMMKGKAWTASTSKEVGGTQGVGATFLEETFSSSTASPEHRYHQKAARAVLKELLPESGADIKGHMRSHTELLQASGYGSRPEDFDDLMRILDSEVRLITPTDPEGLDDDSTPRIEAGQRYYQLTHDYLVHSLRAWLTRKQRETRRGRTKMRLEELSAAWNAKPENRHLPSVAEWISINLLTSGGQRTELQRSMLRSASRLHGFRWGAALLVVLGGLFALQRYVAKQRQKNLIASTATAVDALRTSSGAMVPFGLRNLENLPRELVRAELRNRFDQADGQHKLAIAYALAELGEVDHNLLVTSVSTATAGAKECSNIVTALDNSRQVSLVSLTEAITAAEDAEDWTTKARLAIVGMHLGDSKPASDMLQFEERPDPIQRTVFVDVFPKWRGDLNELARQLRATENGALRSGLSLAVGSIAEIDDQERQSWQELLSEWYMNQPDAGTHSAAGWALRNWECELPTLEPSSRQAAGQDWLFTTTGLTMLRIPAGEFVRTQQEVRLTRDFFLSDREISVGLFQQFMEDAEYAGEKPEDWERVHDEISPSADHPVQQVSWNDAAMFCNWLSRREGLTPCYQRAGEEEIATLVGRESVNDALRLIDGANGYRLPSEAEWEYACRAGTRTSFTFGEDEAWLNAYGVYFLNSGSHAAVCGSKLCNAWGLFDMHGNVQEWCGDWYAAYGEEPVVYNPLAAYLEGPVVYNTLGSVGRRRVLHDGSWLDGEGIKGIATYCRSANRRSKPPLTRSDRLGFRVARVLSAKESLQHWRAVQLDPERLSVLASWSRAYERAQEFDRALLDGRRFARLQQSTIVPPNSEWRWLHPVDGLDPMGSDPDFHSAFFAADFDDSDWRVGQDSPGPFGGFGYGDPAGVDIGTPPTNTLTTAYFRHRFTTDASFDGLTLHLQRDDGVIIYLNGHEVGRDNMRPVAKEAFLLKARSAEAETELRQVAFTGSVERGEHVLAISLHNQSANNSDMRLAEISLRGRRENRPVLALDHPAEYLGRGLEFAKMKLGELADADIAAAFELAASDPELLARFAEEMQALLWEAAKAGDVTRALRAIDRGADVHRLDTRGNRRRHRRRALDYGVLHNDAAMIQALLAAGAEINATNRKKIAVAYHLAGDRQALDALLKQHPEASAGLGDIYAADEDYEKAIAAYSKAITPETQDADLLAKRAKLYAATKQWNQAKADWLRVIELRPNQLQPAFESFRNAEHWSGAVEFGRLLVGRHSGNIVLWWQLAPVLALNDDHEAYCEFSSQFAAYFNETREEVHANMIIKGCLLRTNAVDLNLLPSEVLARELDEETTSKAFLPWGWSTRGLQAFRRGDAESAVTFLAKSQEHNPIEFTQALNQCILALAQHRLNRADEARKALSEASRIINKLKSDGHTGHHDLLIAEILYHEAEALLGDKTKSTSKENAPSSAEDRTPPAGKADDKSENN